MCTRYVNDLPKRKLDQYTALLINKVYSILPLYEEHGNTEELVAKVESIFRHVDGFLCIYPDMKSSTALDILSYLQELKKLDTHKNVKSCVFKVCNLLSELKVGD